MNRNFASGGKLYSMHVMPVMIDTTVQIGSTGAVSSFVGPLVSNVVRNSTGIYTISISEPLYKLYHCRGSMQSPSSGLSGILSVEVQNAPNASISSSSSPQITVKCLDAAGVLADPASGSALNVLMICSNSSVIIQGE